MNLISENILTWKSIDQNESISHMDSHQSGQKLYLKKKNNSCNPKTVFFIFHDLCNHSGGFDLFCNWLMKNITNIEIYMMDYVGHGMSSGTRGHFDNFEILVKDQLAFIKKISVGNDQDVIMLGHGLGGLVTVEMYNKYSHIMTKKPHKLILSNFILNLDHSILNVKIKHSFLINKFTKSLKLINLFDANKMSNSGDAVLANFQDPLYVHRPTLNAIVEINTKAKLIYQEAYFLDIPILVGWGMQDPYVSKQGMNYFIKGIKKNLLFEKTYSHMKHDLYNEVDSSIFYNDIKNWIENEN